MNLKQITRFDRYFFILKKMHCKRIHSLFQYPKSNIILRLSVQRQSLSVFNEQIWSIKLYMVVARYSYLYGTVIFFVSFWGWSYHLMLFARCGSFWELYGSFLARNDKTVCFEGVAARFRVCSFYLFQYQTHHFFKIQMFITDIKL